ncbi:MAG: aminotransferase class I/II-fold pyridoxal phosphate-dependent enzyme, partial [Deltaproteobacteria bacterium]|nr:aminotransferase class I/II-fold pyridoxal phosphate-dependent enzyme [Deltaproteobacteria bacterium]
ERSGRAGGRAGGRAAEPWLADILRESRANFGVAPPTFVQRAASEAWLDDAHVTERRQIFLAKRSLMLAHLRKLGLSVSGDGAFYLWVRVPAGDTSDSYAQRLAERGILVTPGTFFGPSGTGFVRLSMVPTLADCQRAIDVWPA